MRSSNATSVLCNQRFLYWADATSKISLYLFSLTLPSSSQFKSQHPPTPIFFIPTFPPQNFKLESQTVWGGCRLSWFFLHRLRLQPLKKNKVSLSNRIIHSWATNRFEIWNLFSYFFFFFFFPPLFLEKDLKFSFEKSFLELWWRRRDRVLALLTSMVFLRWKMFKHLKIIDLSLGMRCKDLNKWSFLTKSPRKNRCIYFEFAGKELREKLLENQLKKLSPLFFQFWLETKKREKRPFFAQKWKHQPESSFDCNHSVWCLSSKIQNELEMVQHYTFVHLVQFSSFTTELYINRIETLCQTSMPLTARSHQANCSCGSYHFQKCYYSIRDLMRAFLCQFKWRN